MAKVKNAVGLLLVQGVFVQRGPRTTVYVHIHFFCIAYFGIPAWEAAGEMKQGLCMTDLCLARRLPKQNY